MGIENFSALSESQLSKNLIVITGPSGAGKTSIIHALLKKHADLEFSISHTTRLPRDKERDGSDYYFISTDTFKEMIDQKAFLEWAEVHGNFYGTSKKEVAEKITSGKKIILDVDVQGSLNLQKEYRGKYIFIATEDIDVLQKRLKKRHTDSKENIAKRLKNAKKELSFMKNWNHVIINTSLEGSLKELEQLIYSN